MLGTFTIRSFPSAPWRTDRGCGRPGNADFVAGTRLATALIGDSIAANLFMVGYAYQKGLIPLSA